MNKYIGLLLWLLILAIVLAILFVDSSRTSFILATKSYPALMGFIKFAILATMGELLGRMMLTQKWTLFGINLWQRALVWGLLGMVFSYVFPLYSGGVDLLIKLERLPTPGSGPLQIVTIAFWKSTWINLLFAFPFMTFHRITDTLIDQNLLFSKWPFMEIWRQIDWDNMWKMVAPTIVWFWIPAHTITFSLPPEYRILLAACLGIVLGLILSTLKTMKKRT
ncbi:MAG: hypothetical protein ISR65_15820 [Bacteriovoracaceae bacterium]|nr:hypothetical protein [Bacteriovoracaceae bacterium]